MKVNVGRLPKQIHRFFCVCVVFFFSLKCNTVDQSIKCNSVKQQIKLQFLKKYTFHKLEFVCKEMQAVNVSC